VTNKYLAAYLMTISGSVAAIELEDLVAGKSKQIGPELNLPSYALKKGETGYAKLEHCFSYHRTDCRDSGTQRHRWCRDRDCMDSIRCLSGSFCGQSHYEPPTARLRHEAECLLLACEARKQRVRPAYGALVIGLVDNILRPILVGKDTKMPDYVVLISTLGDLAIFGLNGFVIGPVIAAMFIAAWDIFSASRAGMQMDRTSL
jgi:AI-2E family transporter